MKTSLLAAALLWAFVPARAQEPTLAHCRAAQAAFYNQTPAMVDELAQLSFGELERRSTQMVRCTAVDTAKLKDYLDIGQTYNNLILRRMRSFFRGHPDLYSQMLKEKTAKGSSNRGPFKMETERRQSPAPTR